MKIYWRKKRETQKKKTVFFLFFFFTDNFDKIWSIVRVSTTLLSPPFPLPPSHPPSSTFPVLVIPITITQQLPSAVVLVSIHFGHHLQSTIFSPFTCSSFSFNLFASANREKKMEGRKTSLKFPCEILNWFICFF